MDVLSRKILHRQLDMQRRKSTYRGTLTAVLLSRFTVFCLLFCVCKTVRAGLTLPTSRYAGLNGRTLTLPTSRYVGLNGRTLTLPTSRYAGLNGRVF